MLGFIKKFWGWFVSGLAAIAIGSTVWHVQRLKKKIKLLELDKFVLETEAKNSLKKTEIMMDRVMIDAIRKEAQRLLSEASNRGMEIQKLQRELQKKLGEDFKDWDSLEKAAKGTNGNKA